MDNERANMKARVAAVFGGMVVAVLLVESLCRALAPQPPLAQQELLLNRGRLTKPGAHRNIQPEFSTLLTVNQHGFVDHEWDFDVSPDILLIGDSFVQGAQVQMKESVGRRLMDNETTVWSMGIPGAGTTTELLLLQQWIPKAKPNIVLLGLLPSNDILNNHPDLESKSDKPFVELTEYRKGTVVFEMPDITHETYPLAQYSHLLRWALRRLNLRSQTLQKMDRGGGTPIDWQVYNPRVDSTWEEGWDITALLIKEMQILCDNNDIRFGVVLFPSIEEISTEYQTKLRVQYPALSGWTFDLEQRTLDMLSQAGIASLNVHSLYSTFQQHPLPNTLYYPKDHHWTPDGHALASKSLKAWLQSRE